MSGIVIGGNITALLKLAGTKYMPDFEDKILLLESLGGTPNLIGSLLHQLDHIGVFDKIKGIILGSFTAIQENGFVPDARELVLEVLRNRDIPVVKTDDIGHDPNAKCIVIGKCINLVRDIL